jgi:hypothetical protein
VDEGKSRRTLARLSTQLTKIMKQGRKSHQELTKLWMDSNSMSPGGTTATSFFENVQDVFNPLLEPPTDLRKGIQFLEEFLRGNDPEGDSDLVEIVISPFIEPLSKSGSKKVSKKFQVIITFESRLETNCRISALILG